MITTRDIDTAQRYQTISREQSEKQQQLTQLNIDFTKLNQQKIALIEKSQDLDETVKSQPSSARTRTEYTKRRTGQRSRTLPDTNSQR